MGCASSKHDCHPRIFHVWNVDGDGRHLKPGRIEVTDSQLILYQKENIVVKWPLKSLRRYGFDSEVFSFECGRRCSTGPGVYAFKCKRAQALFTILQECINNSGGGGGGGAGTTSISMPSIDEQGAVGGGDRLPSIQPSPSVPNGTLQNGGRSSPTVDSSGYLEPITVNSHLHYPSGSRSVTATAGSPGGYVCIHSSGSNMDWSGVASSLPNCCSLGNGGGRSIVNSASTHHYTNAEIIEQANCSNRMCVVHHYVNSSVVSLEVSPRCCVPPKCSSEENENTYINSPMVTLSPGHMPCSGSCCAVSCSHCADMNTNYAKLDDLLKQEQSAKRNKEQPFYVNVKPDGTADKSGSSASSKCVSGRSTPVETVSKNGTLTSPTSPVSAKITQSHCYANLASSTSVEEVLDKDEDQVNYAVLDLDQNDVVATPAAVPPSFSREHSLVNSPVRSPEGYAQIDFDKTVALSNSANPCPFNDDSMRKTRHNAVIPCSSMSA